MIELDVRGREFVLVLEIENAFDGAMRRHMAREALHHDVHADVIAAQALRQLVEIVLGAEGLEIARFALDHRRGSVEPIRCKARRQHAQFRGASEMQLLHHAAVLGMREFEQPARERARDAERVHHFRLIEAPSAFRR